jgi:hypothetical protein
MLAAARPPEKRTPPYAPQRPDHGSNEAGPEARAGGWGGWRRCDEPAASWDLHERDDNDHAGEKNRDDRVGMAGNIEVEHWAPSFLLG